MAGCGGGGGVYSRTALFLLKFKGKQNYRTKTENDNFCQHI